MCYAKLHVIVKFPTVPEAARSKIGAIHQLLGNRGFLGHLVDTNLMMDQRVFCTINVFPSFSGQISECFVLIEGL